MIDLDWLRELSSEQLFGLAKEIRIELVVRIDHADAIGDGPMVNALCATARRIFVPGLCW